MENHSFHIVFYVRELGGITVFFVVIEKILKTKKKRWGKALVFEKIGGFCHAELNERVEVATSSYFATDIFVQRVYSVLVAKNYQKFLSRRFINIKKKISGCFLCFWLSLHIAIMKRCAEWCALQLYCTSLKPTTMLDILLNDSAISWNVTTISKWSYLYD